MIGLGLAQQWSLELVHGQCFHKYLWIKNVCPESKTKHRYTCIIDLWFSTYTKKGFKAVSNSFLLTFLKAVGIWVHVNLLIFVAQFMGVLFTWLYITRVEDAIAEYGHYQDGLLGPRNPKQQSKLAKWCKCMPETDWDFGQGPFAVYAYGHLKWTTSVFWSMTKDIGVYLIGRYRYSA